MRATVLPWVSAQGAYHAERITLAEAGDRVQVTEVDEAGSVPRLKVANMAGTQIGDWITWARRRADRPDPFTSLFPEESDERARAGE